MSTHNSPQGPEDHARLAEDFPSPSAALHLDMAAELERQAAVAATTDAMEAAEVSMQHDDDEAHQLEQQLHHGHHMDQGDEGEGGEMKLSEEQGQQPGPMTLEAGMRRSGILHLESFYTPTPHPPKESHIPASRQLEIMREFYMRNPTPSRAELDMLAEKTGRPWRKVREYFRQRRNKGRGIQDLDGVPEPARATGWLQMSYRSADPSTSLSQLGLYSAYRTRFDPYHTHTPLMTGQELIQLAIATFPGCEMARDEGEYVLKGMDKRDKEEERADEDEDSGKVDKGIDGLVEPVRASTWLLNNFQQAESSSTAQPLTQTDLYTAYATRFSFTPPPAPSHPSPLPQVPHLPTELALHNLDGIASGLGETEDAHGSSPTYPPLPVQRLLDPLELITLTRMTFPECEPVVDEQGRFVVRGIAKREGVKDAEVGEMFPFAAMNAPRPSSPSHPLTSLLKRKLAQLHSDPDDPEVDSPGPSKRLPRTLSHVDAQIPGDAGEEITAEDRKLIDGLKRFRGSKLGQEVRDVCISQ